MIKKMFNKTITFSISQRNIRNYCYHEKSRFYLNKFQKILSILVGNVSKTKAFIGEGCV